LRAARANLDFRTDKNHPYENQGYMKNRYGSGFIQDRRLRADSLFIRAQSTIRADVFSSAPIPDSAKDGALAHCSAMPDNRF
jgi:hypothetical protein